MRPIVDARDPSLWKGMEPDAVWRAYRAALERAIASVFSEGRHRPVVEVRPASGAPDQARS